MKSHFCYVCNVFKVFHMCSKNIPHVHDYSIVTYEKYTLMSCFYSIGACTPPCSDPPSHIVSIPQGGAPRQMQRCMEQMQMQKQRGRDRDAEAERQRQRGRGREAETEMLRQRGRGRKAGPEAVRHKLILPDI